MTTEERTRSDSVEGMILQLDVLNHRLGRCFELKLRERAKKTAKAVEKLVFRAGKLAGYCPTVIDSINLLAKLALYEGNLGEAEIHLGFVGSVCIEEHKESREFADCLEVTVQWALARRDFEAMAGALKWCADIRTKVLGVSHPETVQAVDDWRKFEQILSDPALDPPAH